jgi:ATP/maltotriose-dependent transcriptional regulator MalT
LHLSRRGFHFSAEELTQAGQSGKEFSILGLLCRGFINSQIAALSLQ